MRNLTWILQRCGMQTILHLVPRQEAANCCLHIQRCMVVSSGVLGIRRVWQALVHLLVDEQLLVLWQLSSSHSPAQCMKGLQEMDLASSVRNVDCHYDVLHLALRVHHPFHAERRVELANQVGQLGDGNEACSQRVKVGPCLNKARHVETAHRHGLIGAAALEVVQNDCNHQVEQDEGADEHKRDEVGCRHSHVLPTLGLEVVVVHIGREGIFGDVVKRILWVMGRGHKRLCGPVRDFRVGLIAAFAEEVGLVRVHIAAGLQRLRPFVKMHSVLHLDTAGVDSAVVHDPVPTLTSCHAHKHQHAACEILEVGVPVKELALANATEEVHSHDGEDEEEQEQHRANIEQGRQGEHQCLEQRTKALGFWD
mmetsp:Transcript_40020/g.113415  ORF Transcript_40020/g.113415 Transcript_40020/m.113415 type:complete len:367 (+) Transcript_40020:574-1674(+)